MQKARSVSGKVSVFITLHPPTRKSYDPDNKIKAILDLLVKNGLIDGDDMKTIKTIQVEAHEYEEGVNGTWVNIIKWERPLWVSIRRAMGLVDLPTSQKNQEQQ